MRHHLAGRLVCQQPARPVPGSRHQGALLLCRRRRLGESRSGPPGRVARRLGGLFLQPQSHRTDAGTQHQGDPILCLRNHFERCFSAYSFYRTIARRDKASATLLGTTPAIAEFSGRDEDDPELLFEILFHIFKLHSPAKSEGVLRGYFLEQADNISRQSFRERIDYETGFFLSRRSFPFFSILGSGFFTYPLRNLLTRYKASDICLLTLDRLDTEEARSEFVRDLLGPGAPGDKLPPVPSLNATGEIANGEERPDFHSREWDFLRDYFRRDLADFRAIAGSAGVSLKYVNPDKLDKYLADGNSQPNSQRQNP